MIYHLGRLGGIAESVGPPTRRVHNMHNVQRLHFPAQRPASIPGSGGRNEIWRNPTSDGSLDIFIGKICLYDLGVAVATICKLLFWGKDERPMVWLLASFETKWNKWEIWALKSLRCHGNGDLVAAVAGAAEHSADLNRWGARGNGREAYFDE